MEAFVVVALGGGLGSALRYGLVTFVNERLGPGFPWGTLSVNVVGSLLIGMLFAWLGQRTHGSEVIKLWLITGVLGGFTTFSAFSLDTLLLLESRHWLKALMNVSTTVFTCLLATAAGMWLASALIRMYTDTSMH